MFKSHKLMPTKSTNDKLMRSRALQIGRPLYTICNCVKFEARTFTFYRRRHRRCPGLIYSLGPFIAPSIHSASERSCSHPNSIRRRTFSGFSNSLRGHNTKTSPIVPSNLVQFAKISLNLHCSKPNTVGNSRNREIRNSFCWLSGPEVQRPPDAPMRKNGCWTLFCAWLRFSEHRVP